MEIVFFNWSRRGSTVQFTYTGLSWNQFIYTHNNLNLRIWFCTHGVTYRGTLIVAWVSVRLTHWGRDKTTKVSQTTFAIAFSWIKIIVFSILTKISLKFVPQSPISNISALVQIMACSQATSHYLNQWWLSFMMNICKNLFPKVQLAIFQHWFR